MKPGKFITVEGIEGVGKSTNIHFIEQYLRRRFRSAGINLVVTREPGGTPLAEEIRSLLLQHREESVDDTAELLLVFAARAQHFQQIILPALERGDWVLCDRFTDATFAYQGAGRGLDANKIALLETLVQQDVRPDLVLVLDIEVEKGLQRAGRRGSLDRFESEKVQFFERVRAAYKARAQQCPQRYRIIDAGNSLERVQADITNVLDLMIKSICCYD